jgi:hypothetical protein
MASECSGWQALVTTAMAMAAFSLQQSFHKWKYMYEFEQFYIYANHSSPLKANCPLIWRGTSTLLDLL